MRTTLIACWFAAFLVQGADAQHHPSPAVPMQDLDNSMKSVSELFSWPSLDKGSYTEADEELRLWLGGGATWPGMVLRIRRISEDSAIGQLVTWWQKGDYGEFIRQAIESDPNMGCDRIRQRKNIEGCIVSLPVQNNYSSILAGEYGDSLRTALFASELHTPAASDSVDLAVEYRLGKRFGRAIPVATDSLNSVARPAFCIFRKAMGSGKPKVYADPFDCR